MQTLSLVLELFKLSWVACAKGFTDYGAFRAEMNPKVQEARKKGDDPLLLFVLGAVISCILVVPTFSVVAVVESVVLFSLSYLQLKASPAAGTFFIGLCLLTASLARFSRYFILLYVVGSVIFLMLQVLSKRKFEHAFRLEVCRISILFVVNIALRLI